MNANAQLDVDAEGPLYLRLRQSFRRRIASGQWRPGSATPTEHALAAEHQVSVGTVRKALDGLVGAGELTRKAGLGTFVRRPVFDNALARFFRMTDAEGRPLRPKARIVSRRAASADSDIAARLELDAGAPVVELFRVRLIEGEPSLAERISLPFDRFAPLLDLPLERFGDLIYPLYESALGQVVACARERISFGSADTGVAEALRLAPLAPVAIIERVAAGHDGRPLEARRSFGPASRFSYQIEIR